MRQRVAAVRDRASALRGRASALRERLRPSTRRADQLWKVLIALAFALPLVATGFEIFRQGYWIAGLVFAVIIVLWVAVMWWGWRQSYAGNAETAPATSGGPAAPPLQPMSPDGHESDGQPAGRT